MSKGRKTLVKPGHTFRTDSRVVKESLNAISLQTLWAAHMLYLPLIENSVLLQRWWHQTNTAMRNWTLKGLRRATAGKTKTRGYSATNGEVHKSPQVSPSANDTHYFLSQQDFSVFCIPRSSVLPLVSSHCSSIISADGSHVLTRMLTSLRRPQSCLHSCLRTFSPGRHLPASQKKNLKIKPPEYILT